MFISNCESKFVTLDNGLSFYFQQRDDGGVEYDIFRLKCEPIDGGILEEESLEDGIYMDSGFLQNLVPNNLASNLFDKVEDHIVLILADDAANALRNCISDYGCDESVLEDLADKISLENRGNGNRFAAERDD